MSRTPSERKLRRLVSNLGRCAPEDLTAILTELEEGSRRRVPALLGEFHGEPAAGPALSPTPLEKISGLSPWLQARIDAAAGGKKEGALSEGATSMTATASEALLACATKLLSDVASSEPLSGRPALTMLFAGREGRP